MNHVLSDPIFQSAVAPFFTALICAVTLNRMGGRWTGLAVTVGFYLAAWLITGLHLLPLTSTHKVLWLGAGAAVAALVGDAAGLSPRTLRWPSVVLGAAAAIWVIWPVLARGGGYATWGMAAGMAAYAAWLMGFGTALAGGAAAGGVMLLALALATGVCAVYGASALLGQLGGAVAAAAGAYVLLAAASPRQRAGATLMLPATLLCALFGVAGHVYAQLPWSTLGVLAVIPVLAHLPLRLDLAAWKRIAVLSAVLLPAAGAAIFVTRHVAGPLPAF